MTGEKLERICFDCAYYFPSRPEASEYGICLADDAVEPYFDELVVNLNFDACQELISEKEFSGETLACKKFEEAERIEIDDESELGQALKEFEAGTINEEKLKQAILLDEVKQINWETVPVDQYAEQLESGDIEVQKAAARRLINLVHLGNEQAFNMLWRYFETLPPPRTIEEVHYKVEVLEKLKYTDKQAEIIPVLIEELYATPSNNTTRQWINCMFTYLSKSPESEVRQPLEAMLEDKRFSPKLKKKIESILLDLILRKFEE